MFYQYLNSPIGFIKITANNEAINEVIFVENEKEDNPNALTQEVTNQLMEYFEGKRKVFNLPLSPIGTSFQQAVWEALCSIPYGETRSYDRVIGASGKLVGYGGGINKKIYLLDLEKAIYKK